MNNTIPAPSVISEIREELNYSRSHIANILRTNAILLKAKQTSTGRWIIPVDSIEAFKELVRKSSGKRYRLGERGPQKSAQ